MKPHSPPLQSVLSGGSCRVSLSLNGWCPCRRAARSWSDCESPLSWTWAPAGTKKRKREKKERKRVSEQQGRQDETQKKNLEQPPEAQGLVGGRADHLRAIRAHGHVQHTRGVACVVGGRTSGKGHSFFFCEAKKLKRVQHQTSQLRHLDQRGVLPHRELVLRVTVRGHQLLVVGVPQDGAHLRFLVLRKKKKRNARKSGEQEGV